MALIPIAQSTHRAAIAFFGVLSIMMEKSALAGPAPFTLFTITYKVALYAPAERADTLPLFHLYPICALCPEPVGVLFAG